jgi:hypothetical protein
MAPAGRQRTLQLYGPASCKSPWSKTSSTEYGVPTRTPCVSPGSLISRIIVLAHLDDTSMLKESSAQSTRSRYMVLFATHQRPSVATWGLLAMRPYWSKHLDTEYSTSLLSYPSVCHVGNSSDSVLISRAWSVWNQNALMSSIHLYFCLSCSLRQTKLPKRSRTPGTTPGFD